MRILMIWKRTDGAIGSLSSLLFCAVLPGGVSRGTCVEAMSAPAQLPSPSTAASAGWNAARSSTGLVTVPGLVRTRRAAKAMEAFNETV